MKVPEVNFTTVVEFLVLGFPTLHNYKLPFFSIVLLIYCMTICENLLIICLVSTSHRLHSPMYFFLGHLALSDIILVTNIVPKMLDVVVKNGSVMRFAECLAQFYIYGVIICVECFLLAAMSYDRYLAICKPLHYNSIMNVMLKYRLTVSSWALSFMLESISLVLVCRLDFCGPNVINHFFCDYAPLLQLSCSDTSAPEIEMFVLSFPIIVLPFLFVITTYVYIFHTIFGIRSTSTSGWQKTFSTCSPHLTVVSTFYGSILIIYMVPYREHSMKASKLVSLIYTVLPPLLNPIIYSLRNKEIHSVVMTCLTVFKRLSKQKK
ncbi:olfactory receptor 6F1-like [Ranitomeya imitator]|uniref:olfactory receptor 6F1-like n=1 Tax=Ranitomeya imitator TaxID=111125 RepID=UPI0037E751A0